MNEIRSLRSSVMIAEDGYMDDGITVMIQRGWVVR
ncbi:MAG: hypothetical protein PWQ58_1 [Archaeoglobaceae archaeon]|nr:hypothetical protein [Archaeoglobaceae archaeon]